MKIIRFFFFSSIILTGFVSGMDFANAVGYLPAMEDTPTAQMIPYWQNTDRYMRARMPILGNAILACLLVTTLLLARRKPLDTVALLLSGLTLALQVTDLIIILTQNLPVNQVLEKIDPAHIPAGFDAYRQQALRAYYLRAACSIAAGLCITLAYFRFEATLRLAYPNQALQKV